MLQASQVPIGKAHLIGDAMRSVCVSAAVTFACKQSCSPMCAGGTAFGTPGCSASEQREVRERGETWPHGDSDPEVGSPAGGVAVHCDVRFIAAKQR